MRKITCMLFVLLLTFLAACSANEQENSASQGDKSAEQTQEETNEEGINVDKGLLNVEITLPASFFEGEDIDTVIANAKKDGVSEVTKNADGSLTYKMPKSKHKEMVNEMGTSIDEGIDEMKSSGDYPSIKDITHNKDFSEFTLVVDKAAYEDSFDGFAALGLGMQGSMYHLLTGANQDDYKVKISMKDEATQEVFNETIFPDDMEESEEETE